LNESQDVDVLFKIPQSTFDKYDKYESNAQSGLLQEVKNTLQEKYTTTDEIKAWGKVILVRFSENHHNVELLPALELEDGTYKIPNSENGGSWEIFDPKNDIDNFSNSNNGTDGLTRGLVKMIKSWERSTTTLSYKSYQVVNDVIAFTDNYYGHGKGETDYSKIVLDYFDYLINEISDDAFKAHINTAYNRGLKAIEYADYDQPKEASEEWRKVFGEKFPLIKENPKRKNEAREISNPARPWSC